MERAAWLVDKDGKINKILLDTVEKIMINTADVEAVEFMKFNDELQGE